MDVNRLQPPQRPTRRPSTPSVGLRRVTSSSSFASSSSGPSVTPGRQRLVRTYEPTRQSSNVTRRRSSSEPQRPTLGELGIEEVGLRHTRTGPDERPLSMPSVTEEPTRTDPFPELQDPASGRPNTMPPVLEEAGAQPNTKPGGQALERPHSRSMLGFGRRQNTRNRASSGSSEPVYDEDLVNLLDVIDPEVATLSTLTNVQNSLFIPDLGRFLNRRPTYTLSTRQSTANLQPSRPQTSSQERIQAQVEARAERAVLERRDSKESITSKLSESRYAVLPHGVSLEGWTQAEKDELNDHVRHLLHSRREAFRRGWRGFGQYVRRPMGLFVTVYATLITLFGAAWVFFLIGWISVGAKQYYVINVIDNVLVALFAIMGDGLAPFRTVDTYHMIFIAHYHHLTWKLRQKKHLPDLPNHNDLPAQVPDGSVKDLELGAIPSEKETERNYYSVLTEKQQKKLEHHQTKFSKSHTFYKPHETDTHFAFPLRILIAIVVLLDCHSVFQIALGTFTWTHEDYNARPFAVTTAILCCSICCNIAGGVLISIGDRRSRKKDVKERMFRQQLTEDAIHRIEQRKEREAERNDELDHVITPDRRTSDDKEF